MREQISAEVWWQAVRTLDHAYTYIQEDAGQRDITWDQNLQDACELLEKHANKLRSRAVKLERTPVFGA